MEGKGFITRTGRVVQTKDGHDVIAELFYKERRYNLRRVYVARDWIAVRSNGQRVTGEQRRIVIAAVLEIEEMMK